MRMVVGWETFWRRGRERRRTFSPTGGQAKERSIDGQVRCIGREGERTLGQASQAGGRGARYDYTFTPAMDGLRGFAALGRLLGELVNSLVRWRAARAVGLG